MQKLTVAELTRSLPTDWMRNYIRVFEAGRVQKHPQARFVSGSGECCLVAALVAAETGGDVVGSAAWSEFRGGPLEELSRRFEATRLTGQEFYEECLLGITEREALPVHLGTNVHVHVHVHVYVHDDVAVRT